MNMATVMATECGKGGLLIKSHPHECDRPIKPFSWTANASGFVISQESAYFAKSNPLITSTSYKGLSVDLAAALLASAGTGGATVDTPSGAAHGSPSLSLSNAVVNAGVLTAGAGAIGVGGDLGLAGMAAGLLLGGGDNQPVFNYTIASNVPFLSYYRFFPKSVIGKASVTSFTPYMQQGYDLILSAHNGTPIAPGNLIFKGQLNWGGLIPANEVVTKFKPYGGNVLGNNHSFFIGWYTSARDTGPHIALFEDTTPAKPVINPKVGFMVGVRTGQPGFFYTPKQVEALQRHLPFASKWYAVFNTKTSAGTGIDVIHNGKLYKVFS
ncbi:hypothetical protein HAP94_14465 [Acidithiobacillus ferrivorans]|nr:hypothetical protein [Acidithiobacillus ferrivorans]